MVELRGLRQRVASLDIRTRIRLAASETQKAVLVQASADDHDGGSYDEECIEEYEWTFHCCRMIELVSLSSRGSMQICEIKGISALSPFGILYNGIPRLLCLNRV